MLSFKKVLFSAISSLTLDILIEEMYNICLSHTEKKEMGVGGWGLGGGGRGLSEPFFLCP